MKTFLELPDSLLKEAQVSADRIGLPLVDFVAQAIQSKLLATGHPTTKPWMKHFGALRNLHTESKRIDQIITDEFEIIDEKAWIRN